MGAGALGGAELLGGNVGVLGGRARPLALPLGELARLKAVTERAGCTRGL